MKDQHHNTDNVIGGLIGFIVSIVKCFMSHIDVYAIIQSMICALAGYLIVRAFRHYFPENPKK